MNTPAIRFRVLVTYEGPTVREDAEPNCITVGHGVHDTHAAAAQAAADLLSRTPAAICASIRREVSQ